MVKRVAEKEELSLSEFVCRAIEKYLDDYEGTCPMLKEYDRPYADGEVTDWIREARDGKSYPSVDEAFKTILDDEVAH
jgi:hypothetical protein